MTIRKQPSGRFYAVLKSGRSYVTGRTFNTKRAAQVWLVRAPVEHQARPKAVPTGPIIPTHYRVRHDKIDRWGAVTVRSNSRLHHIGLGARLAGTPISLLIDDLHIRVMHRHTDELIRELILDPTRDYQRRGRPPGPAKQTAATPRPTSRCRPKRAAAAGVKAGRRHPQGPGLDTGEDGPPSPAGMSDPPENATMSRDTC
jgi:hypothetical protein